MKQFVPLFLPLIVSFIFVLFLSFKIGDSFLTMHDSPFYLTYTEVVKDFGSYWNENSFGFTNYLSQAVAFPAHLISLSFHFLGSSTKTAQLSFIFISLISIWYSSFFFFGKTFVLWGADKNGVALLLSSSLYTFNLYMIASMHGGLTDTNFTLFIATPVILFIVQKIILKSDSNLWLLIGIIFGIILHTGPFALALLLTLSLSLAVLHIFGQVKISPFQLVLFFIGLVAVGLFSLVSLLLSIYYSDPSPLINNLEQYKFADTGLAGYFRFFFEWTINQYWHGKFFHPYYPYYASGVIIALTFALWLPVWEVMSKLKRKGALLVLLMLVFSIFLAKGIKPPFEMLSAYLYRFVPLFNIFRTPDTKFGFVIATIISLFVGFVFVKTKSIIFKVLLAIAVLAQICVFFTAIPITEINNSLNYDRIISVPDTYHEISKVVNTDNREGYLLVFPGTGFSNYDFRNGDGFTGQDLLGKLIKRPVIYSDGFIFGDSRIHLDSLIKNPDSSDFGASGIRYILIRKDSDDTDTTQMDQEIRNNKQLSLLTETITGNLYQTNDEKYMPLIRLEKEAQGSIRYRQKSQTEYEIELENPSKQITLLFMQSFHPGWSLDVQSDHFKAFQYANGWHIDLGKVDRTHVIITLSFTPQRYYWPLIFASLFSLSGLLYCLFRFNVKKTHD